MIKSDHNRLLKKIAKERLKPFGIIQYGQSRTFLFDKGWFTVIIEFQPSSWSKGTYLNIGVDLNFYPRDYFAFSYGYRETGFNEFKDEEQFSELINKLCNLVIVRVRELDREFIDLWVAKKTLNKDLDAWRKYEIGILKGLINDYNGAQKLLNAVINEKCEHNYEFKRQQIASEILEWLDNEQAFENKVKELIEKTRQLKKLPIVDLNNLTERKITANNTVPQAGRNWWKYLFRN